MTRTVCITCGLDLDPDAPGERCGCRRALEEPARSTVTTSRQGRDGSSSAPRGTTFSEIARTACALANSENRELEARDLTLAAAIHRSTVEA